MMALFIGPNGSGKSAAAERLAVGLSHGTARKLVYVATMVPADDDGRRRIAAHRRGRSGLGFVTCESPRAENLDFVGADDVVLLEDVSNLLANLTFSAHAVMGADAESAALERIQNLRSRCRHLVAVTIGGLFPQPGFDDATAAYIEALDRVNTALARQADRVIAMPGGEERR